MEYENGTKSAKYWGSHAASATRVNQSQELFKNSHSHYLHKGHGVAHRQLKNAGTQDAYSMKGDGHYFIAQKVITLALSSLGWQILAYTGREWEWQGQIKSVGDLIKPGILKPSDLGCWFLHLLVVLPCNHPHQ